MSEREFEGDMTKFTQFKELRNKHLNLEAVSYSTSDSSKNVFLRQMTIAYNRDYLKAIREVIAKIIIKSKDSEIIQWANNMKTAEINILTNNYESYVETSKD